MSTTWLLSAARGVALCCALLLAPALGHALSAEQALSLASGDTEARITALAAAAAQADVAPAELARYLQALLDDKVKLAAAKVFVLRDGKVFAFGSRSEVPLPEGAEDLVNNNRMRGALLAALGALKVLSPDLLTRQEAVRELMKATPTEAQLPLIDKAYGVEADAALKAQLGRLRAGILIESADRTRRLDAANTLATSSEGSVKSLLQERLAPGAEADPEVRAVLQRAVSSIDARLVWGERAGLIFTGISLGSILLLVALGLAITYGLMGVINMAHGELMMIGAYATYGVQNLFRTHLPGAFDWYILAAIPVAFAVSAGVGAVLERTVIRWLYGRPLETLLATWGISLMLMQSVRSLFGAQNVPVENPAWLSGGVVAMSNLTLPYNRIAIVVFALLVLAAVALLIARTRLGLFVRGVTQNRRMAACVGVDTARVDMMAFALGSGIAGLAGCALSQVGNVGPDLGQSYIVDAFMVVVLGGVGQLAGTVIAGLGLGVLNKLLEGLTGAVLAKIMVLVLIVVFIQKRPQGLFAMKGRSAEA